MKCAVNGKVKTVGPRFHAGLLVTIVNKKLGTSSIKQ